jgi:hypothetical protein
MRISIATLKNIEVEFGEFDINQVLGGSRDTYLRFGYWRMVNKEKLQEIVGSQVKVEEELEWESPEGNIYMYRLK